MQTENRTALISAFATFQVPIFAVIDGGHFDAFQQQSRAAGINSTPLYHQTNLSAEAVDAGPHVALMDSQDTLHRLLDFIGDMPAAVFWAWAGSAAELHKHLRTLNVVEIEQKVYGEPGDKPQSQFQKVIFRHADPDVLEVMMLTLSAEQRAQVFGAAKGIAHYAPSAGGVRQWA